MERIVAFAGAQGVGCLARFCSLKDAKKFIAECEDKNLPCCFITGVKSISPVFRDDEDEGHRYCSCSSKNHGH